MENAFGAVRLVVRDWLPRKAAQKRITRDWLKEADVLRHSSREPQRVSGVLHAG